VTPGTKHLFIRTIALLLLVHTAGVSSELTPGNCPKTLDFDKRVLAGDQVINLCDYLGKVILVVNTASECVYTPQYKGLEALYRRYKDQGLVVLGFPSNDFGGQEPGTEKQIQNFCRLSYSIQFPMFAKIQVRRENADLFYRELAKAGGGYPKWNFHKYLIDRNGTVFRGFPSRIHPDHPTLVRAIEDLL
jgi:glutathione peroxidase